MDRTVTVGNFTIKVSEDDDDVAYVRLPTHSRREGQHITKSVRLFDVMGKIDGPDVILDFDENGTLIGIEIVG